MEAYFVNEKQEIHMTYRPWLSRRQLMVVVGRLQMKVSSISLIFLKWGGSITLMWDFYYRCVKVWMVKIWRIFDQSSISPNFYGTKVSLHTVSWLSNGFFEEHARTMIILLSFTVQSLDVNFSDYKNFVVVLYPEWQWQTDQCTEMRSLYGRTRIWTQGWS